jgi:hypothetical protein
MSFRPLKPAHLGHGSDGSRSEKQSNKGRNRETVVQACNDCRKTKTKVVLCPVIIFAPARLLLFADTVPPFKCDGKWPKCTVCIERDCPCGYLGRKGQSRAEASKLRLESLEKLVTSLRTCSIGHAQLLLGHIRNSDALETIIRLVFSTATDFDVATSTDIEAGTAVRQSSNLMVSSSKDHPRKPSPTHRNMEMEPLVTQASRELTYVSRPCTSSSNLDQKISSSLPGGLPLSLVRDQLSAASVTKQAIDSFFSCSGGKHFHNFSKNQVSQCFAEVYDTQYVPTEVTKAQIGALMAVASVDAQYMPDTFSRQVEAGFYEFFESAIEHWPLLAVKVCTLLAHYNILRKAMISLAYFG